MLISPIIYRTYYVPGNVLHAEVTDKIAALRAYISVGETDNKQEIIENDDF